MKDWALSFAAAAALVVVAIWCASIVVEMLYG